MIFLLKRTQEMMTAMAQEHCPAIVGKLARLRFAVHP